MLKPSSEQELADAIRTSDGPLAIQGGGTRGLSVKGTPLTTCRISGITLYEPGALTIVAKSGTPLAEIEAALEKEKQILAFEPFDMSGVTGSDSQSTIGGVVACNASGSRRVKAGAARDFLLGVRFVDGSGEAIKNGGRVMKNVTGYDLARLMCGARGTLGVLTEVSLKVLPKPEATATLSLRGLSDADALNAMSVAMATPYDVTGALHAPACIEEEPTTLIRLEGFAESVAYRAGELAERLLVFGGVSVSDGLESWQAARNLTACSKTVRGEGAVWGLSLKPSDAPRVMQRITEAHDCLYQYDWAGGRVWVWASLSANLTKLHAELQSQAGRAGGHATLMSGPKELTESVSRFQPETGALAALSRGLRQKFDPRGILNPGLMD